MNRAGIRISQKYFAASASQNAIGIDRRKTIPPTDALKSDCQVCRPSPAIVSRRAEA
jgi:hypothetical protein